MSARLRCSLLGLASLFLLLNLASAQQDPAACSVSCRFLVTPTLGPQGLPGLNGTRGETGANGQPGERGIAGMNGTDGKDGANGKDGIDGINGTNGADGKDGANGKDGIDGINGTNGTNGTNGRDGKDGVDATVKNHIVGSGSFPAFEADWTGGGSGVSITLGVGSTDTAGLLLFRTGLAIGPDPNTAVTLIKVTYIIPYARTPFVSVTPANPEAAALSGTQQVWVSRFLNQATHFELVSGTTRLADYTSYAWWYHVIG